MGLRRLVGGAIVTGATLLSNPAAAWGLAAQQAVTLRAIDTLPKGPKEFYRDHRFELKTLSPEAEAPGDGLESRFAVDKLVPFPFRDLPRKEVAFTARFGEAAASVGSLPWRLELSYVRLVEAFKAGDAARILEESDGLALLVAQLSNPLALSDNADGQKTGQHGLYARFTDRLPEAMQRRLKFDAEAARFLDDPHEHAFEMMRDSYVWLDNLLYEEELARRGQAGYTELYYEAFERRVGPLLKRCLGQAAAEVGSYWYSAWVAAGRPELTKPK